MIGSLTSVIAAGSIKEDDNKLLFIQGLDHSQAQSVAAWLAICTGGPVELRHISPAEGVGNKILVTRKENGWALTSEPHGVYEND